MATLSHPPEFQAHVECALLKIPKFSNLFVPKLNCVGWEPRDLPAKEIQFQGSVQIWTLPLGAEQLQLA